MLIDQLSIVFVLLITGVGGLIHVYSVGYMAHDDRRRRFFAFLNLFVAAMLLLVLADNYLVLFVGWEGVGLASYLLIGFWQYKPVAATAAKKAFVVNRVGDMGMSLADHAHARYLRVVGLRRRQRRHAQCERHDGVDHGATAAARRVWQVRAGSVAVLALGRDGGPDSGVGADPCRHHGDGWRLPHHPQQCDLRGVRAASTAVVVVGTVTLLFGAWIGCAKDDIKRVLAGSTMSQIGYMMLAAGIGPAGYAYAIFLLLTHGFFKADMFLGAGSVMHATNDEVDMRRYGALRRMMPITFVTFAAGYLAIIGFPFFSGFYAKDHIIEVAFERSAVVGALAMLGAGITAFYMTRLMLMTFFGAKRWQQGVHPHESPPVMLVPLVLLGIGSAIGGLVLNNWIVGWLDPAVGGGGPRRRRACCTSRPSRLPRW